MTMTSKSSNKTYYDGSAEPLSCTSVKTRKLEKRRILTKTSQRLVVVLVGLPGRGKSFVARKLHAYLTWRGNPCKVFNVGKYRRGANRVNNNAALNNNVDQQKQKRGEVGACDANFFDANNVEATRLREEVALMALQDMLQWLNEGFYNKAEEYNRSNSVESSTSNSSTNFDGSDHRRNKIAIFDATNSTKARRDLIMNTCKNHCETEKTPPIGIIFIESICDDKELLEENYLYKIRHSPDFEGLTEEEAMQDLKARATKYEERYETIDDDSLSYVKLFNFSSKILANNIYGRAAKVVVPALMAWHVAERPIFLCRAGKTFADDLDLDVSLGSVHLQGNQGPLDSSSHRGGIFNSSSRTLARLGSLDVSSHSQLLGQERSNRRAGLNSVGDCFRVALATFIALEGEKFMERRKRALKESSVNDSLRRLRTGTSLTGTSTLVAGIHADADTLLKSLSKTKSLDFQDDDLDIITASVDDSLGIPLFPCYILTSTMPRAIQTATWDNLPFEMNHVSNLNPIDKGDFTGLEIEEIAEHHPDWYNKLSKSPFTTRFPGGESYQDVVTRLESIIIEIEQQLAPVVVVSHVSVIQVLLSYFRQTSVDDCTKIEVPMHTVIELRPLLGGGWQEVQHTLIPQDEYSDGTLSDGVVTPETPIWEDRKDRRFMTEAKSKVSP